MLPFITIWMNQRDIVRREVKSDIEKQIPCDLTFAWNKVTETEGGPVAKEAEGKETSNHVGQSRGWVSIGSKKNIPVYH